MKLKYLLGIWATLSLSFAFADSTSPTSKNDSNFEAKTEFRLPEILQHGILTVEARTDVSEEFGSTIPLYIDWETSIVQKETYSGKLHWAPLEIRVKTLSPEFQIFSPEYIRAGVVRALFEDLAITLQGASFLHQELTNGDERLMVFNGFQIGEVTFAPDFSIDGSDHIALTLKGSANISIGSFTKSSAINNYDQGISAILESKGAVGVRISDQLLIELFGGITDYTNTESSLAKGEYGLGVSYLTKNLSRNNQKPVRLEFRVEYGREGYYAWTDSDGIELPESSDNVRGKIQLHY